MNNKAIAYCRCSTDTQEASIEQQKRAIQDYAKKSGYEIIRYFEDEGFSGLTTEKRPAFKQMMAYCESCQDFSYVLVYDTSRFGRGKVKETYAIHWRLEQIGKKLRFATEDFRYDNSTTDEVMQVMKVAVAREFSLNLSKTSYRGHRHYAEKGYHVGGQAKYGYKRLLVDEAGKAIKVLELGERKAMKTQHTKLVIGDPIEVETIKKIYDLYVNKGYGISTITDMLNKEGIPPPKRRPVARSRGWSKSTCWYILHDATYCGHIVYNKKVYANLHEQDKGWGKRKPESEWVVCKNAHEAIISEELFNAVKSKPKNNPKFTFQGNGRGQYSPYLLTGLVRCRRCNGQYQGRRSAHYTEKKDYETYYYVCGSYVMKGKHVCQSWSIPKEVLERYAVERIKRVSSNPAEIERVREDVTRRLEALFNTADNGTEDIDKELDGVKAQISNLVDAVSNGFDRDIATAKINDLKARRDKLEKMRAEHHSVKPVDISQHVNRVGAYLKGFNRTYDTATIANKKVMIRACLGKVEVDPEAEKVYYYFRKHPDITSSIEGVNSVFSAQWQPSPPFLNKTPLGKLPEGFLFKNGCDCAPRVDGRAQSLAFARQEKRESKLSLFPSSQMPGGGKGSSPSLGSGLDYLPSPRPSLPTREYCGANARGGEDSKGASEPLIDGAANR